MQGKTVTEEQIKEALKQSLLELSFIDLMDGKIDGSFPGSDLNWVSKTITKYLNRILTPITGSFNVVIDQGEVHVR